MKLHHSQLTNVRARFLKNEIENHVMKQTDDKRCVRKHLRNWRGCLQVAVKKPIEIGHGLFL